MSNVAINDHNKKLHMRFPLTPGSMTLNCISSNFERILRDFADMGRSNK